RGGRLRCGLSSVVGKKMVNGGGGVKLAMAVLAGGVMILVGQARKRTGERVMKVVVLPAVVGWRVSGVAGWRPLSRLV
ncbi:hypothetical protein Dimus_028628, partial [Dionaea muscipula]